MIGSNIQSLPINNSTKNDKNSINLKQNSIIKNINIGSPHTSINNSKKIYIIHTELGKEEEKLSRTLSLMTLSRLSHETAVVIKKMYIALGCAVKKYNLSVTDIAFLFEATPDANCAFTTKKTQNDKVRDKKINTFYQFIQNGSFENFDKDSTKNLMMYANNLEAILTAIGYTTLYSNITTHPFLGPNWIDTKKSAPSQEMITFIEDIRQSGVRVPSIGDAQSGGFPDRWKDDVETEVKAPGVKHDIVHITSQEELEKLAVSNNNKNEVICFHIPSNKQLLVDSEAITSSSGLHERYFALESHPGKIISKGGAVRAHASGSAPLTLAAAFFLNRQNTVSNQDKLTDEELIHSFGGILCATYMLGDYHTLAETAMGICYFHQQIENKAIYVNKPNMNLDKVPQSAYLYFSIQLLYNIIHKNKKNDVIKLYEKIFHSHKEKSMNPIQKNNELNSIGNVLEFFVSDKFKQSDIGEYNNVLNKLNLFKTVSSEQREHVFDLLDLSIRKMIDIYSETISQEHKNKRFELYEMLQRIRVTIARSLNNQDPVAHIKIPEVLEKGQKLYHAGHIWNIRNILAWGHDRNDYDWYTPRTTNDILELGGGTYYSTVEPAYVDDNSNYVIEATVEEDITGASLPQQGDLLRCNMYKSFDKNSNFSLDEIVRGFKTVGKEHNFIMGQQPGGARTELVLFDPDKKIRISKILKYQGIDQNNNPLFAEVSREKLFQDSYNEKPWKDKKNTFI